MMKVVAALVGVLFCSSVDAQLIRFNRKTTVIVTTATKVAAKNSVPADIPDDESTIDFLPIENDLRKTETVPKPIAKSTKVEARRLRILFFTASWCDPCQAVKNSAEGFSWLRGGGWKVGSAESSHIQVIDTDENVSLYNRYRGTMNVIPLSVFIDGDRVVSRLVPKSGRDIMDQFNAGVGLPVKASKGRYPSPAKTNWTFPGTTRQELIQHLQTGEHAGKFANATLAGMSFDELKALHSDDHSDQVDWSHFPKRSQ